MRSVEYSHQKHIDFHTEGESLLNLLNIRWSPRAFSNEKISRDTIVQLFDAGRRSMSCYNEQPWRVIFATKEDEHYQKLFDCLGEFNQQWVHTAPCLGLVLTKVHFTNLEKENRHRFYDAGAFMAYTVLRATSMDLYVHQMAGFSAKKAQENFQIPKEYEPATMFVIGKLGEKAQLPEDLRMKENPSSPRKPIKEFLFGANWGQPY